MSITITVELPPDVEDALRSGIAQRDFDRVRHILTEALTPTVTALFRQLATPSHLDEEWETLADQLADVFEQSITPDAPVLSTEALSRAGIYAKHP